ncbi:hypothetical protein GF412_01985 [Candidatus Micrarchaeota archaeon]|nr:hypothetical protein [Candidatus Micrarchaeota archaeon]MBD3417732.1 hypothetical protein [Candidatus Micrarchaeota archaeon]
MAYIETLLSSWLETLKSAGTMISMLLIILGGLLYGIAQLQPGETRGKWQTTGIAIVVGGILIAAILGAADLIQEVSSNLFK